MNNKRTNYLYDLCNFDVYRTKECIDDDKIQLYLTDLSERVNKRFREKTLETVPKTKLLR